MQKNVWGYFRCPNGSDKEKGTDMKEMIKKMREERGGFTLAELLVVVAIVAVLVAIAVPLFSSSLTSAEEAVKKANERSVKAEVTTGLPRPTALTRPSITTCIIALTTRAT